jgi:hypothetical protein
MIEILSCPICTTPLDESVHMQMRGGAFKLNCPNCGEYILGDTFYEDYIKNRLLTPDKLATLSYAIRRAQNPSQPIYVLQDLAGNLLRQTRLPSAAEQINNLILYLGSSLSEPGETQDLNAQILRATLGSITNEGASWVLTQALEEDLIQGLSQQLRGAGGAILMARSTLSIKGWGKFEELQTDVSNSKRAFMAMQYGNVELDRIFYDYFKPAAKRAGYDLIKLDEVPRAGLIDDRLRLEIRTSRFLIADLSHGNQGAYWEAGFAEGLGRPVIYTCEQSVFDNPETKPHFDTNHYLMVCWNSERPQEAAEQLITTIRATLPSEAKLRDD